MVQNKEIDIVNDEYFNWMYHLVCNEKNIKRKIQYKKLFRYLHSVTFVPMLDMDENRRIDGLDFRYRFGYENGYPDAYIDEYLNTRDCSMLEMMIALSCRVEDNITSNYLYGDRTGQWFWSMIINLGLSNMDDKHFDYQCCEQVVDRFLSRRYEPNGAGGLFLLSNPRTDLRDVDIWRQCMWFLNENTKED